MQKITYAGVMAGTSFRLGGLSLNHLADLKISTKQVERVVRRIGEERCAQRDEAVEAFQKRPLLEKCQAPKGVTPPAVAVVMPDGGRLQIRHGKPELDSASVSPKQTVAPAVGNAGPGTASTNSGAEDAIDTVEPFPAGDLPPLGKSDDEEEDAVVQEPLSKGKHWREGKVGVLLSMASSQGQEDPCPNIPQHFLEPGRIEKLARELKARVRTSQAEPPSPSTEAEPIHPVAAQPETPLVDQGRWDPPELQKRKVVATRRKWKAFGPMLQAAAWSLGFFAAARRAFVGDGSTHVWGVWRRHFPTFEPILDLIHALAYVYAAARAGRSTTAGWEAYRRWIAWVWQGKVSQVLEELRQRQQEVGMPEEEDKEGSPRRVIEETLRYLENHQGQMKYDEYRRKGLPITSSHIESEIKRINHRVKGTEKFWTEEGAEAILQLRADYLSDDKPMEAFWEKRQAEETGQRRYRCRS